MIFFTAFYLNLYICFAALICLTLFLYCVLAFLAYRQSLLLSNISLEVESDV